MEISDNFTFVNAAVIKNNVFLAFENGKQLVRFTINYFLSINIIINILFLKV